MASFPPFPEPSLQQAEALLTLCRARGVTLTTAESCTGGLIAAALTAIAGSSDVFTHGFVTYANAAKVGMIGVAEGLIDTHGAVSEPVARAMAEGALKQAGAGLAIAVTGIAGPGGATERKPVGLVYIGVACAGGKTVVTEYRFTGDRHGVRLQSVEAGLSLARQVLEASI